MNFNGLNFQSTQPQQSAMVNIYVDLIIKRKKKFSQVPANLKEDVKQVLIERGREDLIDE